MADVIFPGKAPISNIGVDRLPGNMDLSIWQGDAQTFILSVTQTDGTEIDLSTFTPTATIRSSYNDPVKHPFVCTKSAANQVTLYLSSANCKALNPGSYIWEFQLTSTNGDVRTIVAGDVTVYAEVDA